MLLVISTRRGPKTRMICKLMKFIVTVCDCFCWHGHDKGCAGQMSSVVMTMKRHVKDTSSTDTGMCAAELFKKI